MHMGFPQVVTDHIWGMPFAFMQGETIEDPDHLGLHNVRSGLECLLGE